MSGVIRPTPLAVKQHFEVFSLFLKVFQKPQISAILLLEKLSLFRHLSHSDSTTNKSQIDGADSLDPKLTLSEKIVENTAAKNAAPGKKYSELAFFSVQRSQNTQNQ